MPRLSKENRNCVVDLYNDGMCISAIKERLEEEKGKRYLEILSILCAHDHREPL